MMYDMHVVSNNSVELAFSTADNSIKYVLVEQNQVFVSDYAAAELTAKIDAADLDDEFFVTIESYALDDCDSSYFDDSAYKQQILDTIIYYVTCSKIESKFM